MEKPTPAVIFRISFMQTDNEKWHIGAYDLLDYMDKPEKFIPKNITQNRKDFLDYMGNPEKSLGVIDDKTDVYSEADKKRFRQLERSSKKQGCPKYVGVLSFNNDFLRANGYMHDDALDDERMRDVARAAIAEMIDKSKKLDNDNVYYTAAIHKNTDNIHIHYSVLEYEFREDRTITYKNAGMNEIELEAIFAAKSKAANMIAAKRNKAQYEELYKLQRELLLPKLSVSFGNTTADIYNLAAQLPIDKHWQYNRPRMRQYHTAINNCIDSIIRSSPELERLWSEYNSSIDSMQEYYKYLYGKGDLQLYSRYKVSRLQDFYARAGQSLLDFIKTADFSEHMSDGISDVISDKQPQFAFLGAVNEIPENECSTFADDGEPAADLSENELASGIIDLDNDFEDVEEPDAHLSEEKIETVKLHLKWSKIYKAAAEYFYGRNINQNFDKAKELFLTDYNNGNMLSAFILGKLYRTKTLFDEGKSQEYFRKAYSGMTSLLSSLDGKNKDYVNYKLGTMAIHGLGVKQDYELAFKYFTEAGNNIYALNNLGKLYQQGYGIDQSDEKAFEYFQRAYLSDNKKRMPNNTYALARCYDLGKGVKADCDKADRYYREAFTCFESCTEKSADDFTLYRLGQMCYSGKGTDRDIPRAIEYLKRSADSGNVPAHILLGRIYTEAEDYDTAIAYLSADPVADNVQAQYMLGRLYFYLENDTKAEECLRFSANKDNEFAQYTLGKLLYSQERIDEALEYLRRSADGHNNVFAQYTLGKHFLSERFYDEKSAEKYLRSSAAQDNEYAQYTLGKLLYSQERYDEAIEYLRRSADGHNNAFAQYALGKHYLSDRFYDERSAEKYLLRSAMQDNEYGQYALGRLYLKQGHIKDALEWLHKAADEHGNEFAQLQLGCIYYTYKYGVSLHDREKGESYLKLSAEKGNEIAAKLLKTTFRPKGGAASGGKKRPRFDIRAAAADLARAKRIADNVYSDMMTNLARLQREFELENNIVESDLNYTY